MKHQAIREECCKANKLLPATGLVDLTFGNVSVLDLDTGVFAIKPSGVDYDQLTPADMVIVDLEGKVVEGELRPSSDTPTHCHLLKVFSKFGIRSVVHTHSRNAVAFAQAGKSIPCLGTTHCDYFNGSVPVTREMIQSETCGDYELETAKVILEAFQTIKPEEVPAVLVQHHGPFAWGKTAAKAVETAQALEIVADMALKTFQANPNVSGVPSHLLEKHFNRKHGSGAYYGQENHD